MNSLEVHVKGSSDSIYSVRFYRDGNRVRASCSCAAGEAGQACKHRLSILDGDFSSVIDGDHAKLADVTATWLPGSDLEAAIQQLKGAELTHEEAKRKVSAAKRHVSEVFRAKL